MLKNADAPTTATWVAISRLVTITSAVFVRDMGRDAGAYCGYGWGYGCGYGEVMSRTVGRRAGHGVGVATHPAWGVLLRRGQR
ncbi:hypothetical protein GCM10009722_11980 [Williamsia deligens]